MVKVAAILGVAASFVAADERSAPLSGPDAAAYLNDLWTGYQAGNKSTPVGAVMRATKEWKFYCDGFQNDTGCFNGRARCITSGSILNPFVMLKPDGVTAIGLQRSTGIMFNTSLVETKLGRCTYQYDGGSLGRYNRGCGTMAYNGEGGCEKKASAWYDLDPKTGRQVTADADCVMDDYCPNRIRNGKEPLESGSPPCFWKGPAFDPRAQAQGFGESETHEMLEQRIRNQHDIYDRMTTWDEVVIDAELLYNELVRDPARAVIAMLYHWSPDFRKTDIAKGAALAMALEMQKEFNMSEPVPLVAVDVTMNVTADLTRGPFFFGRHPNPDQGPCCWNGCDAGSCNKDGEWCGENSGNCASCGGDWCPSAATSMLGGFVV
jgi:hypothetical protein